MLSSDQAAIQDCYKTLDSNMADIICYLLPDSVAASWEIRRLLLRSSPHVQAIPDNMKQFSGATRDDEYGFVLRHSAPHKSPAAEFLFGTDPSTCDIWLTSDEPSNVRFRIFKDKNGFINIEGHPSDDSEASRTRVLLSTPSHRRNFFYASLKAGRPRPLENASRIRLVHLRSSVNILQFRVALPVRKSTGEISDVESLASVTDVPSLTSATTFSSLGSQLGISEATEELAKLLLKDEELGPLFRTSLQRTAADKVERNYTRLLAGFAKDLRKEAKNSVEHHVGRLVKFRARFISQTLVFAIDPSKRDRTAQLENFLHQNEEREGRVERFLESLTMSGGFVEATKSAPPPIDSDGSVSDDSGEEGNLPKLSQIKDFILSSKALAILRARLKNFVTPEEVLPVMREQSDAQRAQGEFEGPLDERLSNIENLLGAVLRPVTGIDQPSVSSLTKFVLEFLRPKIPEGHQRMTWVCVGCSDLMGHSNH